jgi:rRNA maturation RNase YbeY
MTALAQRAVQQLKIRAAGTMTVTFVTDQHMRQYNRRALGHDWVTDVLTFRYDGEPVVGEILIAPSQARAYAKAHGLAYEEELSRYVVHGLLHWMGHDDKTASQQRQMRKCEDHVLSACYRGKHQ